MNKICKSIAVLGATGHIAKNLIYSFKDEKDTKIYLFTRSIEKTSEFVSEITMRNAIIKSYSEFNNFDYDGIINCVGIGDPNRLKQFPDEVFFITEEMDLLILTYLRKHPTTSYINFSSGAIYGTEFSDPAHDSSMLTIAVNSISHSDYYGIAKINAEAKHRAMKEFNIIDLRIFGFFSIFIEFERPYILSELIRALKTNERFSTSPVNIVRDYIHPSDLFELVKICLRQKKINTAYDVCSKKPVTKFEMLDYLKSKYNLDYNISNDFSNISITGSKNNYFSESKKTEQIGFLPKYSSLESISLVVEEFMSKLQ